ncbi:MAG: DNA-binding response regulator KdpE, partial [uncultured Thermomicrobiales bacterium]
DRRARPRRRRRAADPAGAADRAGGPRLRGRRRGGRPGGARRHRLPRPGRRRARPGDAGPRRLRRAARRAGLVSGADRRPLRPRSGERQGRGARPRRRRLPDQAVRDRRAAGPAPRRPPPFPRGRPACGLRRRCRDRPGAAGGDEGRLRGAADPYRVRLAAGVGGRRRQGDHAPPPAGAGLGRPCRRECSVAAGLRQLPTPQAGGRPDPATPPGDRAGGGLPVADRGV